VRVLRLLGVAAALVVLASSATASATILPIGFFQETVVRALNVPTSFAFLPDGRILVSEHDGVIRLVKNGKLVFTPVVDLSSRVNSFGDRGLVAVAPDPDFGQNGFLYLLYAHENDTSNPGGPKSSRISRITMSGDTSDPRSEVVLVGKESNGSCNDLPTGADCIPVDSNHMGGSIRFASDGTLFVSTGEGGTSKTTNTDALRSQSLDSLGGKLLRITAEGEGISANPFWTGDASANRSKVWAYGLRNPFRFVLRPGSDTPIIGDVGWHTWEEVNAAAAPGVNFGWPCYEGTGKQLSYQKKFKICQDLPAGDVTPPTYAYAHPGTSVAGAVTGNSVTGGVFYTDEVFPAPYRGAYFFGDYVAGWIRYLRLDASNSVTAEGSFATQADGPVDIELGPDGKLYYLAIDAGQLRRIGYTANNQAPTAVASASPLHGPPPLDVQFSAAGTADPDGDTLHYHWTFGDGSTSTEASPAHMYEQRGSYTATLSVDDGRGGSDEADLTITVGDRPQVTIESPSAGLRYRAGDQIQLRGRAKDEDGATLTGAALQWTVILRHCPEGVCHTHPLTVAQGADANFVAPAHEMPSHIQVSLTATDASGLSRTRTVSIYPAIVGTAGADVLRGSRLRDVVYGGAGDDRLVLLAGNDGGYGGAGDDILRGGPGRDALFGGPGDDVFFARDGARDRVICGPGHDIAVVDAKDWVGGSCERARTR
jgi:glucose/arabinose dehydrogenase